MKTLQNPVIVLSSLALAACSSTSSPTPTPLADLNHPESIKPQSFMMRGSVVIGPNSQTITPCDSQQQFQLALPKSLIKQAKSVSNSPYDARYGELTGYVEPPSQSGDNGDYAGRFIVTHINVLSGKPQYQCHHYPLPTRAFGNTPKPWSATFNQDGLVFTPAKGSSSQLPVSQGELSEHSRQYQFDQGALTLSARYCHDKSSHALYGWHATLDHHQQSYAGCAILGNTDSSLKWAGVYYAASKTNQGFTVSMQLSRDHTAVTRYSYEGDQPDVVETGYWQSLGHHQVQVVMTRHNQQYLVTQRIFNAKHETFTAKKEKVGDTVYPIANGGLVLYKDYHDSVGLEEPNRDNKPTSLIASSEYDEKVDQALRRYLAEHKLTTGNHHYRWLTYDLNGDEQSELLVYMDWQPHKNGSLLVFKNVDGEWQFNSQVKTSIPVYLPNTSTSGWKDMVMTQQLNGKPHKWEFTNGHYTLSDEKSSQPQQAIMLFAGGESPRQQGIHL
ncbi:MAG: COG3650 family protein [Vibrio sp.]